MTAEICPRCGVRTYTPLNARGVSLVQLDRSPYPALSRIDNTTHICSACGADEAMRDFTGAPPIPPDEWPVAVEEPAP